MKGLRNFLLLVGGMVALLLLMWMMSPRKYDWDPTFSAASTDPFGMQLFDQMLSASVPQGYEVTSKSFLDLLSDSASQFSVLAVGFDLDLGSRSVSHVMQLARSGHSVMLVTGMTSTAMDDSLGIFGYSLTRISSIEADIRYDNEYAPVLFESPDTLADGECFFIQHALHRNWLTLDSLAEERATVLLRHWEADEETDSVVNASLLAASLPVGRGEVIVVAMPLLFTNYGMLVEGHADLIFKLLSRLGPQPIVRTIRYTTAADKDSDPLSFVRSQPPLRWAYYLSLLAVLAFMLAAARRRQRAIPVVKPPSNHSLEFIRLIGTLYYQQRNDADLVRKKFVYTAEQLRRSLHVDITDASEDRQSVPVIARNAGLSEDVVQQTLIDLRRQVAQMGDISGAEMKLFVDRLSALNPLSNNA